MNRTLSILHHSRAVRFRCSHVARYRNLSDTLNKEAASEPTPSASSSPSTSSSPEKNENARTITPQLEEDESYHDPERREELEALERSTGYRIVSRPFPQRTSEDGPESLFPNLMQPDTLLDSAITKYYQNKKGNVAKWNVRNDPSYLSADQVLNEELKEESDEGAQDEEKHSAIMSEEFQHKHKLKKYPLIRKRVTNQTAKGRIHRMYQMTVVGNGDGLVGLGEGKSEDATEASNKSYVDAVQNMDYVERFENRTIWTDMEIKFGATRILMRPRPVGFGLRCNPNIHQILKAAGIRDVSAKVWGSRNPINVAKATCMLIQSGHSPLSMGNGIGGKGRRLDAGSGMRGKESIERERGRKLIDGSA